MDGDEVFLISYILSHDPSDLSSDPLEEPNPKTGNYGTKLANCI